MSITEYSHVSTVFLSAVYRDTTIQAIRLCLLHSSVRPTDRVLQDIEQLLQVGDIFTNCNVGKKSTEPHE